MANTYTDTLTEVVYTSMQRIQQEPVGFLGAVSKNVSDVTVASFGSSVESDVVGDVTVTSSGSYAPTMTPSDAPDLNDTKDTFALNTYLKFEIPLLGETERKANNTTGWAQRLEKRVLQGLRTMRNTIEAGIGEAAYKGASRAVGTAGTAPFASNHNALNQVRQILQDNGAPVNDIGNLSLVLNTTAGLNFRNLSNLFKVNEAGTDKLLRDGALINLSGFDIRESAGIQTHTKGTGTGYLVDLTAGYDVGAKTIHVDTGTGTILPGDVVTFNGDDNKYVVAVGFAGDGDGDITLAGPGLRKAVANNAAMTIGNNYAANVALHRDAVELASRAPAAPSVGDLAIVRDTITDPVSGFEFEWVVIPGDGMSKLRIHTFVGYKVWNPFMVATLLG